MPAAYRRDSTVAGMSNSNIGFIGGGNMATSLIGGLVANGTSPGSIWVSDPDTPKLDDLVQQVRHPRGRRQRRGGGALRHGGAGGEAADHAHGGAAISPRRSASTRRCIVSIAAGVREADINRWAGGDMAIVRTMPNTPALVGCGATALCANAKVDAGQRERADAILKAVGITIWVDDEARLDAVTALSGSGPAYYFLLMEIMQATGEAMGLDAEAARRLTLQTALGAARIANESDEPPAVLRERVTSPGGTTERALVTMREGGIDKVVADGIHGACQRSIELGDAFGD